MPRHSLLVALLPTVVLAAPTRAHNLPISEMNIVAAANTMHVEFVVNTAELHLAAEMDHDGDGQLEYSELQPHGKQIARRIVDLLTFRIDDQLVRVDVCGILPNPDTHHVTVRAHYRVDARNAALSLQSRLFSITPSAHVMQVTFIRPGKRHVARLSANASKVLFPSHKRLAN